jgi:4-aminobutyrate aminotransferase-like enzyme
MRERGVLVGRTGRDRASLKIRPPLVFTREHADLLVAALAASCDELA